MKTFNIRKRGELLGQNEFYCELTDEMDKHLVSSIKEIVKRHNRTGTYIYDFGERYDEKKGHVYAIRLPGATRGYIYTDENNEIIEIVFYERQCYNMGCYEKSLETVKDKFMGWKIII